MSEISQHAYGDPWIQHLEFVLWYAIVNGPMSYGRRGIMATDIERLREATAEGPLPLSSAASKARFR